MPICTPKRHGSEQRWLGNLTEIWWNLVNRQLEISGTPFLTQLKVELATSTSSSTKIDWPMRFQTNTNYTIKFIICQVTMNISLGHSWFDPGWNYFRLLLFKDSSLRICICMMYTLQWTIWCLPIRSANLKGKNNGRKKKIHGNIIQQELKLLCCMKALSWFSPCL